MKRTFLIGFVICFPGLLILRGQDLHYSQFNAVPLNINPAAAGTFDGDHRFGLIHRRQWYSVNSPYRTFSGFYDTKLFRKKFSKDILGIGVLVNSDKAGDSELSSLQADANFAYTKFIGTSNAFSMGIQVGFNQRSIDYGRLQFGNQYTDGFDPGASSGENLQSSGIRYFDLGGGVGWMIRVSDKYTFKSGISVYHINQPENSFMQGEGHKLREKFVCHLLSQLVFSSRINFYPSFIFSKQGVFQKAVAGGTLQYHTGMPGTGVYAGAFYRAGDAFILLTGFNYKNLNAGVSYDINVSALSEASDGKGAVELSLILVLPRIPEVSGKSSRISCPAFL